MSGLEWFDRLPADWQTTQLRHVARVFAGGTPDRKQVEFWENGTLPWINSGAVNQDRITHHSELITELALFRGATRLVRAGSVVVALAGQGKTKGMAARTEIATTLNQSLAAIEPGPGLDYRFLYYWLRSNYRNIRGLAGGDLRDGLNLDHIGGITVPMPTPPLQSQIADYLDHETAEIDAFIADLDAAKKLTVERTAAFTTHVLEGPPVQGTVETILGHVVDVNEGQVDPTSALFSSLPLIAPNHIEPRTGRLLALVSAQEQGAISGKYRVRRGQVVYSKIRPALMKATLSPVDALCAADMYAIDARRQWMSNEFLLEYFLSRRFEQYAITMSDRVAMPKLNRDTLAHAPIVVPPLSWQSDAIRAVHDARLRQFSAIADIDAATALAKERRAVLITAAVTGQIDVSVRQRPVVDSIQDAIEEAR